MNHFYRTVEDDHVVFRRDVPPLSSMINTNYKAIAGGVLGGVALCAILLTWFLIRRHKRRVSEDRTGFDILVETKANRQSMLNTGVSIAYPIVAQPPVPLLAPAPTFRSFSAKRGPARPRHHHGHSRSSNSSVSSVYSDSEDLTRDVMTELDSHYITITPYGAEGVVASKNSERERGGRASGVGGYSTYQQPTIDQGPSDNMQHASSSRPYGSISKKDNRLSDATIRAYDPNSDTTMYDDVITRTRQSIYRPPSRSRSPNADPTGDPNPELRRGRSRKRRSSIPYPQPVALPEPDAVPRGLPHTQRSGLPRAGPDSPPRDPKRPPAVFSPATAKDDKPFHFPPRSNDGKSAGTPTPRFTMIINAPSPDPTQLEGTTTSRHDTDQT